MELPEIDSLVDALSKAHWKERDAIKEKLRAAAEVLPNRSSVEEYLELAKKGLPLELKWEIDEVLEALKPLPVEEEAPEPEGEKEEEEEESEDPNRPLRASDLNLIFDDPRGLQLHKTKTGDRYFATQVDPMSGRPQTFELHPQEIGQLKARLQGSPYWVLGSGEGS